MSVIVDIVGHASDLFSRPHYTFDAKPGLTLKGVLEKLSEFAGSDFPKRIYDTATGSMNEHIVIFVNAREARSLRGPDTVLNDGDVVTIMPPMAGG